MTRFITFLLFLLPLSVQAQSDSRPLLADGRSWLYAMGNEMRGYSLYLQTVEGDSTVSGQVWKKVWREEPLGSSPQLEKLMREEQGRVSVLDASGATSLFLDYGAAVGQAFSYDDSPQAECTLTVESRGQVQLADGTNAMRLSLRQTVEYADAQTPPFRSETPTLWTECLGGEVGIDMAVRWHDVVGLDFFLLRCAEGGTTLFEDKALAAELGVDLSAVGTRVPLLSAANTVARAAVYDLQGRRVDGRPGRGFYIMDGRKYVVR